MLEDENSRYCENKSWQIAKKVVKFEHILRNSLLIFQPITIKL